MSALSVGRPSAILTISGVLEFSYLSRMGQVSTIYCQLGSGPVKCARVTWRAPVVWWSADRAWCGGRVFIVAGRG